MKKVCLINQPAGIGDVFFTQKIVDKFLNEGFNVIYPLEPQLMFINDYIKKENLLFCSLNNNFPFKEYFNRTNIISSDDFVYLPLRYADRFYGGSCMEAKYKMVGADFNGWQKHFTFERNIKKEKELYYDVLNLSDNSKYTLLSNTWGTQPNFATKEIYYEPDNNIVKVSFIDGFTLFDWCKVIENANQISIVDTSLNYIIDTLDLTAEKLFLNSRFTPANFSHIINLFNTNWHKIN
jgi:hypothetical protein